VKTILQQLFDGEIYPAEAINPDKTDAESFKINNLILDETEYFYKLLSEKDIERFDKLEELYNRSSAIYGYDCFAYGFRLGASLLIEIYFDSGNNELKNQNLK
jgi:hypothetical protein